MVAADGRRAAPTRGGPVPEGSAERGAWICFEDEAGHTLRPPKARAWAPRSCTRPRWLTSLAVLLSRPDRIAGRSTPAVIRGKGQVYMHLSDNMILYYH